MSLNIRERRQKIAIYLKDNAVAGLETISKALGISKSSVHRHRKAISQSLQPESGWWNSAEGSAWLKLLVLGIVYYFGIKQGVGSESLSQFFHAVRLNQQFGSSASALRGIKREMKDAIIAYEAAQVDGCQPKGGSGICVGGDETFFGGLPILVMIELASGYILSEAECENRTYETWSTQIAQWWTASEWNCHFVVSDGAKALIKLALSGLDTVSVPDLFHAMRSLAQPLGSALARQLAQLQRQQQKGQQQLDKTTEPAQRQVLAQSLEPIAPQVQRLAEAQQTYHTALQHLSQSVHPFDLETNQSQLLDDLANRLKAPLASLSALARTFGSEPANQAIESFKTHIPGFTQGIQAWWQWTTEAG